MLYDNATYNFSNNSNRRNVLTTLASYIADITPKMNKEMLEGFCTSRIRSAVEYVDNYIRYSCASKTKTHLEYLGYRRLSPKEEIKAISGTRLIYDVAENSIFPVEFVFHYQGEEEDRKYVIYLPYMAKGNLIKLSGNNFLVAPVLADKVISIGENIIFINIVTAKYNFERTIYSVKHNDVYKRLPIIVTRLYKNQSKKLTDTTLALPTVMHYLLCVFGYTKTMEMLLGYVPKPVYNTDNIDTTKIDVIASVGIKPKEYIRDKFNYPPTNLSFLVNKENCDEETIYVLGNVFYLIDNFPEYVTIDELDNTFLWKKLMGEIIHSGNHQLAYIMEKIDAHFKDLASNFDSVTYQKLQDIGHTANNLIDLLVVIFRNFNNWILSTEVKSLYNNKSYECELYVLSRITSGITRAVLDISKEELRVNNAPLEPKVVKKIMDKYLRPKSIFSLKKEILYVSSVNYSGDHLYPKNTSMVVEQESDPINITTNSNSVSERKKITASMITIGSILGLPKKNPTPLIRLNPYVTVDSKSGTILPHPVHNEIINATSRLLNNIVSEDTATDITEFALLDSIEDTDATEEFEDIDDFDGDDMAIED